MADNTSEKYNIVSKAITTGILDLAYIRDESRIRYIVENAGPSNVLRIEGRLVGQASWVLLQDITGTANQTVEVNTYEEIKVSINVYDSLSDHVSIIGSSFDNVSGSVYSVNGQTGVVVLDATDVGADPAGTAQGLFDTLGDKYVRTTRYEEISSGTSGTVTLPANSTVVLDDFGGTVDAVVSQSASGKPTLQPAKTALLAIVATSFDTSGNWVFTGTPSSYPVIIMYRVSQKLSDFDSTATNIYGVPTTNLAPVQSVNGKTGEVVLTAADVGALDTVNALTVELLWNQLYPSFYTELTYDMSNNVTLQSIWDGPAKVTPLFTKTFVYSGNQVTQVTITNLLDSATLVKNFNYDMSGFITDVTRVYTP